MTLNQWRTSGAKLCFVSPHFTLVPTHTLLINYTPPQFRFLSLFQLDVVPSIPCGHTTARQRVPITSPLCRVLPLCKQLITAQPSSPSAIVSHSLLSREGLWLGLFSPHMHLLKFTILFCYSPLVGPHWLFAPSALVLTEASPASTCATTAAEPVLVCSWLHLECSRVQLSLLLTPAGSNR